MPRSQNLLDTFSVIEKHNTQQHWLQLLLWVLNCQFLQLFLIKSFCEIFIVFYRSTIDVLKNLWPQQRTWCHRLLTLRNRKWTTVQSQPKKHISKCYKYGNNLRIFTRVFLISWWPTTPKCLLRAHSLFYNLVPLRLFRIYHPQPRQKKVRWLRNLNSIFLIKLYCSQE